MIYEAVRWVYDHTVRPYLPRKIGVRGGVPAREPYLFDRTDHWGEYKPRIIDAIVNEVSDGDIVVDIAAGHGVFAVRASMAGASLVIAYEGASEQVEVARSAVSLSMADESTIEVRHAIVGEPGELFRGEPAADVVHPDDLPDHDIMILDCEGAEVAILDELSKPAPRTIIVETHPEYGVGAGDVIPLLADLGYDYDREKTTFDSSYIVAKRAEG